MNKEKESFYSSILSDIVLKLLPIVDNFEKAKDIKHINKPLLKSLEKENPKTCYKVKNNSLLQLVSLLPEKTIDNIYKNNIS